uniref:Transmembrane protein n=1 Tax=Trepomonas sp. PC1 TaxID=1076344 RepID=A0A146JZK6_9EUKA|eukprot:JAP89648.1 Hypothetical protein TPC1_30857 [Trepomonas sp. PC1]
MIFLLHILSLNCFAIDNVAVYNVDRKNIYFTTQPNYELDTETLSLCKSLDQKQFNIVATVGTQQFAAFSQTFLLQQMIFDLRCQPNSLCTNETVYQKPSKFQITFFDNDYVLEDYIGQFYIQRFDRTNCYDSMLVVFDESQLKIVAGTNWCRVNTPQSDVMYIDVILNDKTIYSGVFSLSADTTMVTSSQTSLYQLKNTSIGGLDLKDLYQKHDNDLSVITITQCGGLNQSLRQKATQITDKRIEEVQISSIALVYSDSIHIEFISDLELHFDQIYAIIESDFHKHIKLEQCWLNETQQIDIMITDDEYQLTQVKPLKMQLKLHNNYKMIMSLTITPNMSFISLSNLQIYSHEGQICLYSKSFEERDYSVTVYADQKIQFRGQYIEAFKYYICSENKYQLGRQLKAKVDDEIYKVEVTELEYGETSWEMWAGGAALLIIFVVLWVAIRQEL